MATWDNESVLIQDFIRGFKELIDPIISEISEPENKKIKISVKSNIIYVTLKEGIFKPKENFLEVSLECLMTGNDEYELKVRFTMDETKINDENFFENFLKDVK